MPTSFAFTEAKIKALSGPPATKDREYHKDRNVPGFRCASRLPAPKPTTLFAESTADRPG